MSNYPQTKRPRHLAEVRLESMRPPAVALLFALIGNAVALLSRAPAIVILAVALAGKPIAPTSGP